MSDESIIGKELKPYRTVKDTVFRALFNEPENLLKLYQALHPEDTETTVADLDIVTLQTVLVADIHNDLGFIVGDKLLTLVEAQSLWSDNILVRGLMYIVKTYQNYFDTTHQDIYSTKRLRMPKPELYVVYTGDAKIEKGEINLSDAFFDGEDIMINARMEVISESNSNDIINQYIIFTKVMDQQIRVYGSTVQAVEETIRICKGRNVLKAFLESHEKETVSIMVELFSQREAMIRHDAAQRAESRAEGRAEGRVEGRAEGETAKAMITAIRLYKRGSEIADIADILEVSEAQVSEWVKNQVQAE